METQAIIHFMLESMQELAFTFTGVGILFMIGYGVNGIKPEDTSLILRL